jgi:hypothetical protein
MKLPVALVVALSLSAFPLPAQAYRWLPARGHSCAAVCVRAGMSPVVSGIYKNGNPFSICRADVAGEGRRPGYNLQPNWATACWVAYGGREQPVPRYECLCDR